MQVALGGYKLAEFCADEVDELIARSLFFKLARKGRCSGN